MDRDKGIEARLKGTALPRVTEGDHRARLKLALLCREPEKRRATPVWETRLAWGCLALILIAWGVWNRDIIFESSSTAPQPEVIVELVEEAEAISVADSVPTMPPMPELPESVDRNKELMALIAKGEGEFIGETSSESGEPMYLYRVILSDSTEMELATDIPIESKESRALFENWEGILSQSILTDIQEQASGETDYLHLMLLPGLPEKTVTAAMPMAAAEWSDEHLAELRGLIAEDKGEFLERRTYLNKSKSIDIYDYTLSDGTVVKYGIDVFTSAHEK